MRRSFEKTVSRLALVTRRSARLTAFCLLATFFTLVFCGAPSYAQRRSDVRPLPSPRYYSGVQYLESGDFAMAANFYRQELRSAFRIGTEPWIDSICYYAMIGESYYQAGDLGEALKNYNMAMTISLAYPNWLGRVTYSSGVSTIPKPNAPWGASRRACPLGVFPDSATITIGEKITDERLLKAGVKSEQQSLMIDPVEILRCIALSIRRRIEILGPLAPFDPMSAQILESFQKRSVAPNHWSITWLDVIWGLALAESDKTPSAVKTLNEALVMAGQYDHSLTGTALLELGHLFLGADKVREAAECYYEASISAFNFGDKLLVEEAIRNYSNATKALRNGAPDPVVNMAYRWAKTLKNAQTLTASFGLELVEEFVYQGKLDLAASGLGALDKTMRATAGRGLRESRAADRWNYLSALVNYAQGDVDDGDLALAKAIEGCKIRSPWALQLMRLDNYVKNGLSSNGALTPRNAADLYEYLLREPTVVDWAVRPTESLAIQMIAPLDSYERWFCILMDRDLKDKAFEVSERVRRERFFRTQTYGGRLLSLRYLLTADDALTTASIRSARAALFLEYPAFEETVNAAKELTNELNSLPTVPTDADGKARQIALLEKLAVVSGRQEALMRFIAAGRVRIPYVFPPVLSVEEVQKRMPPDTAILAFLDAEGETYGFMIGKENLDAWRIGATNRVAQAVSTFLKTLGNSEGTRQIEASALAEGHWKAQGSKLREIVLGASDVEADRFNIMFTKLVVVPDSELWYLPFEALCLPALAANVDDETAEEATTDGTQETTEDETANENAESDAADAVDAADGEEEEEEEESDLDAAYRAREKSGEVDAVEEEIAEDEIDERVTQELTDDESDEESDSAEDAEGDEPKVETAPVEEVAPVKRKGRTARQREELEAYEKTLVSMIETPDLTIRYSATVGLSLPNALGRNAFVETTLAAGETYPKETTETVDAAVNRFADVVSKTEPFRVGALDRVPGAIYASRLKRLVVWDEIVGSGYDWAPFTPGKSNAGNLASDWIASPWGAPRLIVLPALRTRAEEALKNGGDGSELFLPILSMQASGADAMLLSRWRTGGRSAYDLSTDFVKNYETLPVADAWKQAVLALIKRDVVVDEEPRLRKLGRSDAAPTYADPFWWAGYLLIDSGEAVQADELERFDEANVQKAEEENQLLEGGEAPEGEQAPNEPAARSTDENAETKGDEQTSETDDNDARSDEEEGVVAPAFVQPKKEDKSSKDDEFSLGPRALNDDDLAAQDESGDDFFANDDEPEEPKEESKGDEPTNDGSDEDPSGEEPENEPVDDEEDEGLATDDDEAEDADEKDAPKEATPPKVEPKNVAPKKEEPKKEAPKATAPKAEPPKSDAPKGSEVKPGAKPTSSNGTKPTSSKSGKVSLKPKK